MIQDLKCLEDNCDKYALYPFWTKDVTESDQANRLKAFYSRIYPLWASIVSDHIRRELEDKSREKSKDFDDMTVLHLCDLTIYDSGNRPDRFTSGKTGIQEKKEKVVDMAKQAYGD